MKGVIRPDASVLSEASMVPAENWVTPAPSHFTHVLTRAQPFYFSVAEGAAPAGEFPAGTKVALLGQEGGPYCRVVDGRGLSVETEVAGLEKL